MLHFKGYLKVPPPLALSGEASGLSLSKLHWWIVWSLYGLIILIEAVTDV